MIKLFIPNGEKIPFQTYVEEGIVKVVSQKPDIYTTIEKKHCACHTVNNIAVDNTSIFVKHKDQYIAGSTYYRILWETNDDFETSILWLVKSHFLAYSCSMGKYFSNRTQKDETTLERKMTPFFFDSMQLKCGCLKFTLTDTPVYCLRNIVLSGTKKGPTIGSVI